VATTRSEQKLKTRRALIEAALKISAQRGFSALSLRELTREAGIAPTAFYRHFRDMDELGLVLIDEVGLGLRQLMRQARQRAGKGPSVVQTSIDVFMDYVQANPNLFRLLLGERSGSSPSFRKALHSEIERFIGELTEDLGRNARRPLEDVGLAAEAIVAVVFTVGAETLDLPAHRRPALAERIVKEIRLILRGAEALGKK
jgi:AcrR family transcriptional regulator